MWRAALFASRYDQASGSLAWPLAKSGCLCLLPLLSFPVAVSQTNQTSVTNSSFDSSIAHRPLPHALPIPR